MKGSGPLREGISLTENSFLRLEKHSQTEENTQ